ncbi:MAG: undecaprenyldiphospho-muramoylpentapeptide beta-N-acetylglucosaminyltransferase [Desulfovibrionaceae bacterium]
MNECDTKSLHRVLLTTGGTGGHVFPALAVAEELQRRYPQISLLFVGSQYGPEARMVTNAGIEFRGLPVRGFVGRGARALGSSLLMSQAVFKALWVVCGFKPQVTLGFGGYAAFAPMLASRLRGVPTALHEQNAVAGVSNKVLARLSRKIFLSLPDTAGFNPRKCVLTGNPVRHTVAAVGVARHRRNFSRPEPSRNLLVVGGSQGARALNACVMTALPVFKAAGLELLHQTGQQDFEKVQAAYVRAGYAPDCVQPFIEDMAQAYDWADLALCRAGATTVAELSAVGLPAVLVPFPAAAHDHQTYNARTLARTGAAVLVQEADMLHMDVSALILRLFNDTSALIGMATSAYAQAQEDAAVKVVDELEVLLYSLK